MPLAACLPGVEQLHVTLQSTLGQAAGQWKGALHAHLFTSQSSQCTRTHTRT